LIKLFKVSSVVDLGCGPGYYCNAFKQAGVPAVVGYDGTPNNWGIFNNIQFADLTDPSLALPSADLVLCLEVGEHVPKQFEKQFIENILKPVKNYLVLSWATPGQGGFGHVNELPNAVIKEKMASYGMKFLEAETRQIRNAATLWWFKNTLMVFQK